MKKLHLFFILICVIFLIQGCSEPQRPRYIPQVSPAIIAPKIQPQYKTQEQKPSTYAELVIGKTTKAEVIKMLGLASSSMSLEDYNDLKYFYSDGKLGKAAIRIIEKDGADIIYNFGQKSDDADRTYIILEFNKKGILTSFSAG